MSEQQVEMTLTFDADPDAMFRCAACGALPSEHEGPNGYGLETRDGQRMMVWSDACLMRLSLRARGGP